MNKLRELRTMANLTQQQLADVCGLSKNYISQLERGTRSINHMQHDTLSNICNALGCSPEDIILNENTFEYDEDGKLIVDNIWIDPTISFRAIAEINGSYFLMPHLSNNVDYSKTPIVDDMVEMRRPASASSDEANITWYLHFNCTRRSGWDVKLGRAITPEELKEFMSKYNRTDDDISSEFVDVVGDLYGKKWRKEFKAIQIKGFFNPVIAAYDLRDKGIEAAAVGADYLNIRIE